MSVRQCESLGQNPDSARNVIVSSDMKVSVSPCQPPAELLDSRIKSFDIAINNLEGFAVFPFLGEAGVERRNACFPAQFLDAHLVEAAYDTTRHFRSTLQ